MAVFIELTTDVFEDAFRQQFSTKHTTGRAGRRTARRPVRGLEIKEDTYAILKVVRANGQELPLIDSSSPDGLTTSGYANFILQTVQEQRMEKHQIVETFGESYIFFFGEAPRFLNVQAILINSHDFNWEAEWWENYNKYLRGTKLVEMGARMFLFYDDNIVEGYMLNAQAAKSSTEPFLIQLNFQIFLTNHSNISFVGNPNFPIRSSVELPEGIDLTQPGSSDQLTAAYDMAGREAAVASGLDQLSRQIIQMQQNGFASSNKLSDLVRLTSPTFAVSPDVWTQISRLDPIQAEPLFNLLSRLNKPLRGLIAENLDEYVGVPESRLGNPYVESAGVQGALTHIIRDNVEVDDLFRESIQFLSCYGANINSPGALLEIGLGPNFSLNGQASFRPSVGSSFGFGTSSTEFVSTGYNQQSDSLGVIYGSASAQASFGGDMSDPSYGYSSDFGGAGYGHAGFGDYGGLGFGSGFGSSGDPGFKNPEKFTFAGVADDRDAFDRFLAPKDDPTAFGSGFNLTAGATGIGGVSVVSGSPSPFSLVSVEGTLDPTGLARLNPENVSTLQQQQKFGFGLANPYGVSCPKPGAFGFSESFSHSFP